MFNKRRGRIRNKEEDDNLSTLDNDIYKEEAEEDDVNDDIYAEFLNEDYIEETDDESPEQRKKNLKKEFYVKRSRSKRRITKVSRVKKE